MKSPRISPHRNRAFTLIELMTSIVVLALVLVLLVKFAGIAGDTWLGGEKQVNNLSKARAMLDLVARDAQAGVFRDDLPAFPPAITGTLAFYTQRPGVPAVSGTVRGVSLVTYALDPDQTKTTLKRGDMAILWDSPAQSITFSNTSAFTASASGSVTLRDTAPGIVGFRVLFIQADGTTSGTYAAMSGTNPVLAMGVSLAVLDDRTLTHLNTSAISTLRQKFSDPATWDNQPARLSPGLRIFERYVPLPKYYQ
ncbi:MAG: type II secretion system protein J [Chthoniobacteraceae bacterium]